MLLDQYKDPWVWPIATSTHSVMHVIADEAHQRGAHDVAIVYEPKYRFGVEGNDAFTGEAHRLGMTIVQDLKLDVSQANLGNQAQAFVDGCTNNQQFDKCDFVAVLLEPATGASFVGAGGLGDGSHHPKYGYGVPQPLFLNAFATTCRARCNGMVAWTSFFPPIGQYGPAVGTYVNDVKNVHPAADVTNPEVEGAYQGMRLLVQALTQLGASPTRAGLKQVLDSTTLDTGLAPAAKFSAGNHFAAVAAQGFKALYNGSDFTGWVPNPDHPGFITDNAVSHD